VTTTAIDAREACNKKTERKPRLYPSDRINDAVDGEMPKDGRGEDGEVTAPRSEGLSMIIEIVDGGRDRDVMLARSVLLLGPPCQLKN